jgi:CheY-like chemotaxis protein
MSEPSVPRQVLIVEDDVRVRGVLRDVFVADGYQCRVAANGREGLDAFQRERPPLTLTGIRMPVMDGLDFIKRARAIDGGAAPYYSGVQKCAELIPNANFVALRGLDHGTAFREAGVVLPHVTQFFRDATKNTTRS